MLFNTESLLEIQSQPMMIINSELSVIAVNNAWEIVHKKNRINIIGDSCCHQDGNCRHRKFFKSLDSYEEITRDNEDDQLPLIISNRGSAILVTNGSIYLAEVQQVIFKANSSKQFPAGLIGNCKKFYDLKNKLLQAANMTTPVLLLGETGTGKELASEFIHQNSTLSKGEFVIADCTVFGEDLFESELFGHEKGAFTGAISTKKGLYEIANNGTLFLDEIGELPLSQQAKLLRVIESGQFRRVGGLVKISANVRIICATHRNLSDMVAKGEFREDLFYRLSVFPINIPPLRDRKQDISLLVMHFLNQQQINSSAQTYSISKEAMTKLEQHNWPGNIRELRNCMQLARGLSNEYIIREYDIHFMPRADILNNQSIHPIKSKSSDLNNTLFELTIIEKYEAEFIETLIAKYQGNRKSIATEMNISQRTLYRKLSRYNLN